jgi:hypothetical protein
MKAHEDVVFRFAFAVPIKSQISAYAYAMMIIPRAVVKTADYVEVISDAVPTIYLRGKVQ